MRNYEEELKNRIKFIKDIVEKAGRNGIIFANSGGKDCALVGILCKMACEDTVSVIMPCGVSQNYESDKDDAMALSLQYEIKTCIVDLKSTREALLSAIGSKISETPISNIAPRLRMTVLYTIGQEENRLVVGTSNKSEKYLGYFTKWGDVDYDFNPIGDLTASEVFEFLRFLKAPESIINKAPSGGLYEGQTDEKALGLTYASIDKYLLTGETIEEDIKKIEKYHTITAHKRTLPPVYEGAI